MKLELRVYGLAFVMLVILWGLYSILSGNWRIWHVVNGQDGRPSTSKFQFFAWTVVIIFSYVAIVIARFIRPHPHFDVLPDEISPNILLAMGFSVTTVVSAAAITTSQIATDKVRKVNVGSGVGAAHFGALFQDDDGSPSLSKTQMLAWTFIAIVIFLWRVAQQTLMVIPRLPDIEPALVVLTGLGQGAYLGQKLTLTTKPRLTGLSPGRAACGTKVVISGMSFGPSQSGGQLTIDDKALEDLGPDKAWNDTQITFNFPEKQLDDTTPWGAPTQTVQIGVIAGGQASANKLPFTIVTPLSVK